MAERQPSWDKYEAAILLEGILASMKGELTRSDAVKAVSHDLRAMAVHRGIEIDAVYRNTNGISFQMKSMESAYLGRTVFKPATRLFTGVASLYHDSHDEYQKLLKEARAMIIDGKPLKMISCGILPNKCLLPSFLTFIFVILKSKPFA